MNIEEYIKKEIKRIVGEVELKVTTPPTLAMGDFSLACFNLIKDLNPNEVANKLEKEFNDEHKLFSKVEVIGAYLNFYLDKNMFNNKVIEEIIEQGDKYGSINAKKNLLIEHSSINPNASPHIGRSRNGLIGDFLKRLYKFHGYNVETHYFINDIGKQIAMLLYGVKHFNMINPCFQDMLDLYVKINALSESDPKISEEVYSLLHELENGNEEVRTEFKNLTDICVKGQMEIFKQLDIEFDTFTHESDFVFGNITNEILNQLKNKGKLFEAEDGRLYVDLSDYDIPTKEPILVLTRHDKTSLYPLRDIAYTIYKINRNSENNIIVLGEDQKVYMKQIAAVMDILGYKYPIITSYSFVLLSGSKMATRAGTVVLLEDFIKETKEVIKDKFHERDMEVDNDKLKYMMMACIKYAMLNVSREKNVNFNLESATNFTGESGLYILYSIVRINSILKDNEIANMELKYTKDIEFTIIKELYKFKTIAKTLLISHESSTLTSYIFNLCKLFSKYYEEISIKHEEDIVLKNSRLVLLLSIKQVLVNSLHILGIKEVEKM